MKNVLKRNIRNSAQKTLPSMAVMITFLFLGIVVGCICGTYLDNDSGSFLSEYVNQYKSVSNTGVGEYSFFKALFGFAKYPIIVFLLGFTSFGIFVIPCVVFLKGFFSSLSVSAIVNALGLKGIVTAILMFGIQMFITLPTIILVASVAFEFSKTFLHMLKISTNVKSVFPINPKMYVIFFIICLCVLCFCALIDTFLTPFFMNLFINIAK